MLWIINDRRNPAHRNRFENSGRSRVPDHPASGRHYRLNGSATLQAFKSGMANLERQLDTDHWQTQTAVTMHDGLDSVRDPYRCPKRDGMATYQFDETDPGAVTLHFRCPYCNHPWTATKSEPPINAG